MRIRSRIGVRSGALLFLIAVCSATAAHAPASLKLAFKGDFVHGPEEIRAYWTEQWGEVSPHVEPVAFHQEHAGQILVEVHQVVRDLAGTVLADQPVGHRFTVENGLIRRMEVTSLPSSGH